MATSVQNLYASDTDSEAPNPDSDKHCRLFKLPGLLETLCEDYGQVRSDTTRRWVPNNVASLSCFHGTEICRLWHVRAVQNLAALEPIFRAYATTGYTMFGRPAAENVCSFLLICGETRSVGARMDAYLNPDIKRTKN